MSKTNPQNLSIVIERGNAAGRVFAFDNTQQILIGKDPRCDLVLDDRGVSRRHCLISHNQSVWTVSDLGSTNGTVVRDQEIGGQNSGNPRQSIVLCNGDLLQVGEVTIRISWASDPEERTEMLSPKALAAEFEATQLLSNKAKPLATQKQAISNDANPMRNPNTHVFAKDQSKPEPKLPLVRSEQSHTHPAENQVSDESTLPRPFRHFQLSKLIGVGGMGKVYLATSKNSDVVAIKFLRTQSEETEMDRARFLREMEIANRLRHPTIVESMDSGDENGKLFIVMEYCNGGNLAELFKRSGVLNLRRAIRLIHRLLAGVELAHSTGIVHRDLKPQNILLHRESTGKYKPKISDFGLAKCYLQAGESGMTVNGTVGGSWAYMPKEQLTNFRFVSPCSDVWSLGAILYECLTNRLPRVHTPGENPIKTILQSKIVPIQSVMPTLPRAVSDFVNCCLDSEPENRPADASVMLKLLTQVASEVGVEL
jgi:pSer/pThr/pTyr-binding forkhead associated (FHA) protein/tRNA A-37 threonylcarbamoyl transferase component Bud32